MKEERKRIFIGNLPSDANEDSLKERFSKYGDIVSIEVKQRKDAAQNTTIFAFVNITTDDNKLNRCFREIPNLNWQGNYVKLELAKESFLERLKREREETAEKPSTPKPPAPKPIQAPVWTPKLNNVKKYDSASDSDSDDTETPPVKKQKEEPLFDPSFVIKSNKCKIGQKQIKIESFGGKPVHVINEKKHVEVRDKKSMASEEKRKKSLALMKNSYLQQKSAIKNALARIDVKGNSKMKFDDKKNEGNATNNYNDSHSDKKIKVDFFEDNDEDDDINFEVKQQFEGKKGQKLLELQSRFPTDKRFTLDSRFLDAEEPQNDLIEDDETERQLEILESVLGKKIKKMPKDSGENIRVLPKEMFRFDPQKPEHSKFEIKEQRQETPKEKRNKLKEKANDAAKEEIPVVVSQEQFYKVTDKLKESLKEKESFSLLSMFGTAEKEEVKKTKEKSVSKLKPVGDGKNPFKYDSSDTEPEDEEPSREEVKTQDVQEPVWPVRKRNMWRRNFFFKDQDERFQEGLEFIKHISGKESTEPFTEKRRELRNIIRAKVRNVKRNNRPFRKKLGKVRKFAIRNARKKK